MTQSRRLSVKIHDRTQLETVLSYDFASGEKGKKLSKKQKYEVDVYFFFPPQLNINQSTYSKEDFYEDIRPLIRLKEPSYTLEEFFSEDTKGGQSPFSHLKDTVARLFETKDPSQLRVVISELKILACSLSSTVSKRGKDLPRELKSLSKKNRNVEEDALFFKKARAGLKDLFQLFRFWEEIFQLIKSEKDDLYNDLRNEVSLLDENLLHIFYRAVSSVLFSFEKYFSNIGTLEAKQFETRVKALFDLLVLKTKEKKYFTVSLDSSRYEKESYAMRLSYLKKRMWQVLYLDVKDKASFFKKRQVSYVAAAGFAAMWALFANFLIWHELNFQGYSSFLDYSDSLWGLSTFILITAFVGTYILKDRIKDAARDKFQGSIFKHLPDSSEQIWYSDPIQKKRRPIGVIYESKQYIQNLDALPPEILGYRRNRLKGRFIDQEDIIHYHKKIILDTRKIKKLGQNLTAIKDIIRLSIKRYVTRLDDPEEPNYLMAKDGTMKMTMLPKVYYIDLVVKFSTRDAKTGREEVLFECRRLLLNKEGLVRIVFT